ncbi:helix-turn-helix domain-containing protein [Streptomyces sp. NPDC004667]|uniref:helix-turn-helix domain-containing protein n=1 Tax=Streptomyces sp. NPDC004667 TaxID=3154285 RepID=UPI0033B2B59E
MQTDPRRRIREARTAVYRLYDAEERLLYVGITMTLKQRFADHRHQKFWWHLVKRRDVRWYDDRSAAEAVEAEAIQTENPKYDGTSRIPNWVRARHLRPKDPFWRPVAESVLAHIQDGTYPVGSPLPSPRALASLYEVSESSTGYALSVLSSARVVGPRPQHVVRPFSDHRPLRGSDATAADEHDKDGLPSSYGTGLHSAVHNVPLAATTPAHQRSPGVSFREASNGMEAAVSDPLRRDDALVDADTLPPPRIRQQLRIAANLTQAEVAEALGVQRLAIVRWEAGQTQPHRSNRLKYAEFLRGLAKEHPEVAQGGPRED